MKMTSGLILLAALGTAHAQDMSAQVINGIPTQVIMLWSDPEPRPQLLLNNRCPSFVPSFLSPSLPSFLPTRVVDLLA
jgi:hypothetical protein